MLNLEEHSFKNNVSFEDYKSTYEKQYYLCENLGKLYNHKDNHLFDQLCMKWNCSVCRPIRKYKLFLEILKSVYIFDLQKHFIITSPGKPFREKHTWWESYKIQNIQFEAFIKAIKREFGSITYIKLPRAQQDGYCHSHILLNKYIPWSFLNEKRKNYDLGFVSIQKNKDTAEYLNQDFFKDTEWVTPANIHKYSCSRDIMLNNIAQDPEIQYFNHETTLDQIQNFTKVFYGKEPNIENYKIERAYKREFREICKAISEYYQIRDKKVIKEMVTQIIGSLENRLEDQ